jgi:hypothetical protein
MNNANGFAADLREMMAAWNMLRAAVRLRLGPKASEAWVDAVTRASYERSLGVR